jgi:hypothetical protein
MAILRTVGVLIDCHMGIEMSICEGDKSTYRKIRNGVKRSEMC